MSRITHVLTMVPHVLAAVAAVLDAVADRAGGAPNRAAIGARAGLRLADSSSARNGEQDSGGDNE